MNLQFLGTGAADYSKTILEDFPNRFDPDTRRASAALLNGRYLIDAGPHILNSLQIAGIPAKDITDLFFTHLHKDHFLPASVESLAAGNRSPLRVWVREDAVFPDISGIELHRMRLHETYRVGNDLLLTGLPANHGQDSYPQHLLIEPGHKKLYYALDGAWVLNSTFNALRDTHLDMLVLDGTCGDYVGDFRLGEHNSIPMIRLMLPSFRTVGAIDDHTVIYISHLARTLHKSHAETSAICEAAGFHAACDGLIVAL